MTKICIQASGLSYLEQNHIIEKIANQKAYQYRNIGFFDSEDIKQEVRVKCWSVLSKYDPKKYSTDLKVFLSVCAENRIRDIKRSVLYKHNKPCFKCPFWQQNAAQSGQHDCLAYSNKFDCEKYAKHERYVQVKLSASHPIDIDNQRIEDNHSELLFSRIDLIDFISTHLPSGNIGLFEKVKSNNLDIKCLKSKERIQLLQSLKEVLKDFKG